MNYDIRLFRSRPDEDPLKTAHREDEDHPALWQNSTKLAVRQRAIVALIEVNPSLSSFESGDVITITTEEAPDEEISPGSEFVELYEPAKANGVQIHFYEEQAFVSVPYWHDAGEADAVFKEIWG